MPDPIDRQQAIEACEVENALWHTHPEPIRHAVEVAVQDIQFRLRHMAPAVPTPPAPSPGATVETWCCCGHKLINHYADGECAYDLCLCEDFVESSAPTSEQPVAAQDAGRTPRTQGW